MDTRKPSEVLRPLMSGCAVPSKHCEGVYTILDDFAARLDRHEKMLSEKQAPPVAKPAGVVTWTKVYGACSVTLMESVCRAGTQMA